jgi:hypothetical protein
MIKDYEPTLLGIEKIKDRDAYKFELRANERSVTYDKMLYWVDKETLFPVRAEMYSLSDKLLKITTYSEPKMLASKIRYSVTTMEDALVQGSKTVMRTAQMTVRNDLSDFMFTEEYLKR